MHGRRRRAASPGRRLLILQYAGDYREAYERLARGGPENYHAQRYSVDAVAGFLPHVDQATTLCAMTDQRYDELLANGVRAIGAGFDSDPVPDVLTKLAEDIDPTHVVLRTALPQLLGWATRWPGRAIATLAEGLPRRCRRQVRLLNHRAFEWVGCYRRDSAEAYARSGVEARKILPWQYREEPAPHYAPRAMDRGDEPWRLLYVGMLDERKGVGDAIAALARLLAKGHDATLTLAGGGGDGFPARAEGLGVADRVRFAGVVPATEIDGLMRAADVVLVPSHPEHPEGFPLVVDHALRARTPIVASDHPALTRSLHHRRNAMVFPAGDASGLAACVEEVLTDGELYARISSVAEDTLQGLQVPLEWAELIEAWLSDTPEDRRRVAAHALAPGRDLAAA